jgi:hypothetical protein
MPPEGLNWASLVTGGSAAGSAVAVLLIMLSYMRDKDKGTAERDKASTEDARLAREQGQAIVNGVLLASRETAAAATSMAASIASMAAAIQAHGEKLDGNTRAVEEIRDHIRGSGHDLRARPDLPDPQQKRGKP